MIDKEAATGKWRGILMAFGVDERHLKNKHGACPMCGGKDRFRFDDREGRGTWICNQCGSGDGYSLLQKIKGWTFSDACREVNSVVGRVEVSTIKKNRTASAKTASVRKVWGETIEVSDSDPVSKYISARCGLKTADEIRFHPALPYSEGGSAITYHPALVARITNSEGKGVGIHRIYLTEAGGKAPVGSPKKMLACGEMETAAVRLAPCADVVGVAEGIETALAAMSMFGVPTWATLTAGFMEKFEPPKGVKRVVIYGDNDASYTGQASAYSLARKLKTKGFEVDVLIPRNVGTDWADVLLEDREAA